MGDPSSRSAVLLKPSVLVIGRTGMLGQACVDRLAAIPDWTVRGTQRRDPDGADYLDLSTSSSGLERFLQSRRCDYVVNAAGVLRSVIDPQDLESVQRAIRLNAAFPYELAAIASRVGTRVIHVSTDAVFGVASDEPFTESSPTSPDDIYGCTKALGECRTPHVINLRCSIVGRDPHHGRGLVEWISGLPEGAVVNGFTDYTWSAATTVQVADLCSRIMAPGVFDRLRELSHVFHFAPNPPLSKYEFLKMISDVFEKGVTIIPTPNPVGPVRRTLASRFDAFLALLPPLRPWREVLADVLSAPSRSPRQGQCS